MNKATLNKLSDDILEQIRRQPSRSFSLVQLARRHGCEKASVQAAVELLQCLGYGIDNADGIYTFLSAPDLLLSSEIKHGLKTSFIGKSIHTYESVQSTNTLAAHLAEAGAKEGTIVVAESQTRGRGRLGRTWFSMSGKGICLSIVLRPKIDPTKAPGLSIITALSLADTIMSYGKAHVAIKWPNDCLINGRKTAGILTELSTELRKINYVIVGIGININHRRSDFPSEIIKTATSLRAETKQDTRRVDFLQRFLTNFERDYRLFRKYGLKKLRPRIVNYSHLLGKKVKLETKGSQILGTALDIDDNGSLILDTDKGLCSFHAGEVTLVKEK